MKPSFLLVTKRIVFTYNHTTAFRGWVVVQPIALVQQALLVRDCDAGSAVVLLVGHHAAAQVVDAREDANACHGFRELWWRFSWRC